ncbi:acetoacetate decarboxylase family protein [Streptomyces sp. NPDC058611]|uniref:acetoacetate decarboxylase family protein n=1 Tax=unclassified Streptomyces TaxID=2593676 RepID=UPI0036507FFD
MNRILHLARLGLSAVPSPVPRRQRRLAGRHALVDGIPFELPVDSVDTPALMAGFTIDREAAARMLPGGELHPVVLPGGKGLLVVTVVNYLRTDIGRYIEYSIAIACTHGPRPAPPLLPGLLRGTFGTGQYVVDLPVSSEISVKGGKGIWGMPKHQAKLDFKVSDSAVSSQYEVGGRLGMYIEIERPPTTALPLRVGGGQLLRVPRDADEILHLSRRRGRHRGRKACPRAPRRGRRASGRRTAWPGDRR